MIFYMTGISYTNPYFLAPSPLKPFKSNSRYENPPGEPLTAHSDPKNDQTRQHRPKTGQISTYVDLCFLYEAILGPLKAYFDQLDHKILKNWSYLSYPHIFISKESMFHARSNSNLKKRSFISFIEKALRLGAADLLDLKER